MVSVGAALFLFQQMAGINAVVYYSTSVFRSAGITSDVAASALVGASNVFGMLMKQFPYSFSNLSCTTRLLEFSILLCRHCYCLFSNGQAGKKKPANDKFLRNGRFP